VVDVSLVDIPRSGTLAFIAAIPILLALLLLVGIRLPARIAMPICAGTTAVTAWWLWQVPAVRIAASIVEAAWVTVSILMIVFGALFFLAVLRRTKAIEVLQRSVSGLSDDPRIQVVLVGWLLGSFLEGSAGFGSPAAITAPLLIGLGFRPVLAVVVALVGDSTAVSFGAIGTPMLIGFGQGLAQAEGAPAIQQIAERIATLDLFLGTLMPAILVVTFVVASKGIAGWRLAVPAIPFACMVGFGQSLASFVVVIVIGPELPSLIGPLVGFAVAFALLRFRRLVPVISSDLANVKTATSSCDQRVGLPSVSRAVAPYLLLVLLLVLTRMRAIPIGVWLSSVEVGLKDLFGTGISVQLQPLYSPGAIFVFCTFLSGWFLHASWKGLGDAARSAGQTTWKTALALMASIITVRIFLQSGGNDAELQSMPLVLADGLAYVFGDVWQGMAPWVGSLGAFMSGSATFSNMLFALLQLKITTELGYDPTTILALQGIGAAAGNMTCIHNVVAACAVAGTLGEEGNVIRKTAVPMIVYLVLASALSLW
jgi:lactate permease